MWQDIQVYASGSPLRIEQIVFIAEVTEPIHLPNGAIADPATLEWLSAYVDSLVARYDLSGTVLLATDDTILFERSFGFADAERKRPVTSGTLFSLASASKMFTAVAIARLVADGKLSYSDTIDRFFPDFPDSAFARKVTIGHLLSHTSGIGEYWTKETNDALRRVRSTADVLPFVYRAGTRFAPGTQVEYSNSNFILAGLIVERAAKQPYEEFARKLITEPLAMKETGPFDGADTTRPIAETLYREGDHWARRPRATRGTAAGGWFSTPRDMFTFMRGLRAGRLLPPAYANELIVSHTRDVPNSDEDFGYGFILETQAQVHSFGHGGIAPGVNSEVRHYVEPGVTLVMFSNQDNGAYDDLRRTIGRLVTGAR
jgi:CubicO group peptidase (beta-lactamase class C family)